MKTRVAIIGGGASGLMAAITAASKGAEVTIYEAKERLGKKILATGNGKCNYTNLVQEDSCYRGTNPSFSKAAREAFSVAKTLEFFQSIGIEPKIRNGYVYPNSEQAASVADALAMEVRAKRIDVIAKQVYSVKGSKGAFYVKSEQGTEEFDKVILCCGSPAGMKNAKEFTGYVLAGRLGHHMTPLIPALVQLRCREKWFKTVSGVRTEGVVTVLENGTQIAQEKGELLFADYGLSGIPVFQISRVVNYILREQREVQVRINLLPDFDATENVMLPMLIAGVNNDLARERAEKLLVRMELSKRMKHRPAELSGGEQQRVAIARALANSPKLLLADEPTGNLDPKTSEAVFAELISIVKETKLSALIATHNMELAKQMDRVIMLQNGSLVEAFSDNNKSFY